MMAALAPLLVFLVALPLAMGAEEPAPGWVGLNQAADLILTSGTNRSVLANGVDILGSLMALNATLQSQYATISAQAVMINTQAGTISAQAVSLTTQSTAINTQAGTIATLHSTINALSDIITTVVAHALVVPSTPLKSLENEMIGQ